MRRYDDGLSTTRLIAHRKAKAATFGKRPPIDDSPKQAIRHFEAGVRIGELSLGPTFDGLLPWGLVDNRPFIRCMHGFGLCLSGDSVDSTRQGASSTTTPQGFVPLLPMSA